MASILDRIVARKREEVAALKRRGLPPEREKDGPRGFIRALVARRAGGQVAIVAEAKKASPSRGLIAPDFDPVAIARHYQAAGAAAVSVLTERHFFQGGLDDLVQVRAAVQVPVLRKDYIIDALQIEEAAAAGADAVLLIAAILSPGQLRAFREQAAAYGMDALVEVHDEAELESALTSGAQLVGVNNRNLHDFTVDLARSFRLKALVPDSVPLVSESGITSVHELLRLKEAGITAALIGESLMRSGKSGPLLAELAGA